MTNKLTTEQRTLCDRYGVSGLSSPSDSIIGVARNIRDGIWPINGLRHPPEGATCGWYIWAGEELSEEKDFFVPLHVKHLDEWCPEVLNYLGLPPGWRFLIAPDYEDVWEDRSLLAI
jgi:hypothetical protein